MRPSGWSGGAGADAGPGPSASQIFRFLFLSWFSWIFDYSEKIFFRDLIAGVTIGIILIPQGIAYASLVNLPAIYGLYTSFFGSFIYFLFGTCRHLSVGPDSLTCILLGQVISHLANLNENDINSPEGQSILLNYSIIITFITGIILIILGVFEFGFIESILSEPVLSGFVSSIGLILICDQSAYLLGIVPPSSITSSTPSYQKLFSLLNNLDQVNRYTILISCCSITFLLLIRWSKKKFPKNIFLAAFPEVFVLVVSVTIISFIMDFNQNFQVQTLGTMVTGFHQPIMPNLNIHGKLGELFTGAVTIAILGFTSTSIPTKLFSQKYDYVVSPNLELFALGLCSLIGSAFGCFPSFGSLIRTRINDQVGGQSKVVGLIGSIVVGSTVLFLMPLFAPLPKAVTSSILFVVALSLISFDEFLFCLSINAYNDAILMFLMVIITFTFGILSGIIFALTSCLIMLVQHVNKPAVTVLGRTSSDRRFHDLNHLSFKAMSLEGIIIFKVDSNLHFANASELRRFVRLYETANNTYGSNVSSTSGNNCDYGALNQVSDKDQLDQLIKTHQSQSIIDSPIHNFPNSGKFVRKESKLNINLERLGLVFDVTGFDSTISDTSQSNAKPKTDSIITSPKTNIQDPVLGSSSDSLMQHENDPLLISNQSDSPSSSVNLRWVLFDLTFLTSIDATGVKVFCSILEGYYERKVKIGIIGIRQTIQQPLKALDLFHRLSDGLHLFLDLDSAVRFIEN